MAEVGHGKYGLRSGIRVFDDLQRSSSSRKDALIEVEAAQVMPKSWGVVTGTAWGQSFLDTLEGTDLDVSSVVFMLGTTPQPPLLRVQTQALSVATPGTYYFVPGGLTLTIHLADSSDPNAGLVRVTTTFAFSTAGAEADHLVHPILGRQITLDPDMDDWASATNLTEYTETMTGGGTLTVEQDDPIVDGEFSALLTSTGGAGTVHIRQTLPLITGHSYRIFGYYRTPKTWFPALTHALLRVGTTLGLQSDGVNPGAALGEGLELEETGGKVCAFVFDIISHEDNPQVALRLKTDSAVDATINFDVLDVREIIGWRYYYPCVAADGVPKTTLSTSDVYPGSNTTGGGQVRLLNNNSERLEAIFSFPWSYLSREVRCLNGGAFPDGQEIIYNDMHPAITGIISGEQMFTLDDEACSINIEDTQVIFEKGLPTRQYGADFPDLAIADRGRPRANAFGDVDNVRPAATELDGSTGYRTYELVDCSTWPDGIVSVDAVYAYADEEAADKQDPERRVLLDPALADYTEDLTTGTIEITHDVRVIEITEANDKIDFDLGAGPLEASVPVGVYIIGDGSNAVATFRRGLLEAIRQAMNAASGITNIDAVYSETTHLVTISRAKGTLNLLTDTGANRANSIYSVLGYDSGADVAGGTPANTPLFQDPDSTHIIRADITGYADDASGTYTGTPGDPIELGPDKFRFIHDVLLTRDPDKIDTPSFEAMRADAYVCSTYFGGSAAINQGESFGVTVQEIVRGLALQDFAEITLDGRGVWHYSVRSATTTDRTPHLRDRDFLKFSAYMVGTDTYGIGRLTYRKDPTTARVRVVETADEEAILLHDRPQAPSEAWDTFLENESDAQDALDQLMVLSRRPIRHFELEVQGHLLKSKVGDLVKLTRSRGLQGQDGAIDGDVFRIMHIEKDYLTHICRAIVHTQILA